MKPKILEIIEKENGIIKKTLKTWIEIIVGHIEQFIM